MLSLKAFHILFVTVSMVCLVGVSIAFLVAHYSHRQPQAMNMALCGFGAAGVLAVYGVWFWGKIKRTPNW